MAAGLATYDVGRSVASVSMGGGWEGVELAVWIDSSCLWFLPAKYADDTAIKMIRKEWRSVVENGGWGGVDVR